MLSAAGGRFAGPLVAAAIAYIATPSGDTNVCTNWVLNADGSYTCAGQPPSAQCAITGEGRPRCAPVAMLSSQTTTPPSADGQCAAWAMPCALACPLWAASVAHRAGCASGSPSRGAVSLLLA